MAVDEVSDASSLERRDGAAGEVGLVPRGETVTTLVMVQKKKAVPLKPALSIAVTVTL